jgi:hypothetical protein
MSMVSNATLTSTMLGVSGFSNSGVSDMAKSQDEQKRDEILKRMLAAPPKPKKGKKAKPSPNPDRD